MVDTCDARQSFVEADRQTRVVDIGAQIARGAQLPEHRLALDAAGLLAQALAARFPLPRRIRGPVRIPPRGDARLLRAPQIPAAFLIRPGLGATCLIRAISILKNGLG
ncbi:hypothetical protein X945_5959 [Burkholderia pseudomallei ABCPW 107]|nr:hypothetical protein X945_5959 [Burkholderia pseudomallei ABCPW 107]